MDYKARTKPEVFKPLIDQGIIELTRLNKGNMDRARGQLMELQPSELDDFWYLKKATHETITECFYGDVEKILRKYGNWSLNIFETSESIPQLITDESEIEDFYIPDSYPVKLKNYPKEARDALAFDFFLDGGDSYVFGIWRVEGVNKFYVASPSGFEIIAQDAVDWLYRTCDFVKSKMPV